ncbi:hypothetical protein [Pseudoxanthomonas mexicana]|uniref:hypothetical protein n=1 Tax=Pseudoxanthomonas mexicana TaxID=128785 RepID=UPI0028AE8060|nr:hypothetical protein [Pseudoxanthomonas mexicana]
MTQLALQRSDFATLRESQPFETLSSYLAAWRGYSGVSSRSFLNQVAQLAPAASVALMVDPDHPIDDCWLEVVAEVTQIEKSTLEELAAPLGPWTLHPPCRHYACIACLDEAGSASQQARLKLWTYATFTTCIFHDLPLIEVPAIGWEWMELSPAQRKSNARLMLEPDKLRPNVEAFWNRLDGRLRVGIHRAEVSAWVAPGGPCRLRTAIQYERLDEAPVWQAILALLSRSWERHPAPALAARGLPRDLWLNGSKKYFGDYHRPVLEALPTIDYFRGISAVNERRACVLVASDAVRHEYMRPFLGFNDFYGWRGVLARMPQPAFEWLVQQSSDWPLHWQDRVECWKRGRK